MIRNTLVCICTGVFFAQAAFSFTGKDENGVEIHERIVADALGGTFSEGNLKIIQKACASQDRPGGAGADEARRHFATSKMTQSLAYIDREKKKALNFANDADTSESDRMRALYYFGLMLHTCQDFYSRSNYLETKLTEVKKGNTVDPYNIDLVDWSKVSLEGSPITSGPDPSLDKTTPETEQGKKKLNGATLFKAAKELAVRETERQWNMFEALVRNRYQGRANAILTAMKKQNCDQKFDIEKIEQGLDMPE